VAKALTAKQAKWGRSSVNPEIILLAGFGLLWGFAYGAIMNLWQWPFITGPQNQSFAAGLGVVATLQHYMAFYLVTSVVWDAIAAAGNVLLLLTFGAPALRALRRFRQRFEFNYTPEPGAISQQQGGSLTG
jgi:energy-coupling factor transport system substrate-specific component